MESCSKNHEKIIGIEIRYRIYYTDGTTLEDNFRLWSVKTFEAHLNKNVNIKKWERL